MSNVEVKLKFLLPTVEPIGEHRVWFRWAFFNPYTGINTCKYDVDCLGPATVDGQEEPYFWSKFVTLTDYYTVEDLDWTVTLYWITTALSLFGLLGAPLHFLVRVYL